MKRRQFPRTPRRGFVLLVIVVLLALMALVLSQIARAAIMRVHEAGDAQTQLQLRWGLLSSQRVLLPQCETFLKGVEAVERRPVPIYRQDLQMGELRLKFTFGDESAKANVAALIRRNGDVEQASFTVRQLCLGSPMAAGLVHLRGGPSQSGPSCFGEVFDDVPPAALFDGRLGPAPVDNITCWSDGKVNIHRASEQVLRETCTGVLGMNKVHHLIDWQTAQPTISVQQALALLQMTTDQQAAAQQLLTDGSTCHSLAIECQTARRRIWTLAVLENDQAGNVTQYFQW